MDHHLVLNSPRAGAPSETSRLRRAVAGLTVAAAALAPLALPATTAPASSATTLSSTTEVVWRTSARPTVRAVASTAPRTVGTRLRVAHSGVVTQLRYYKSVHNRGTHTGALWSSDGSRLASVVFRGETRWGWQSARLATPVRLNAGQTVVATYTAPRGRWSRTPIAFANGRTVGPSSVKAIAGVTGAASRFPTTATRDAYLVDIGFRRHVTAAVAPVSVPTRPTGGFPDAASTGAEGTVGSRGGATITTPGTVIKNTVINGQITVRANNVTLRNVVIRTDDNYGLLTYGKNTVIEDSTIIGSPARTVSGILAYDTGQVIARRVDVSNSEDGVRLNDDSVLEDSYIHDLAGTASAHFDSVTADGFTGWRIEGNTILNHRDQTAAVWIGDRRYGPSEGLLKDNYLAGGGYVIYAGPGGGAGLRVVGNVFSTRYFPKSGRWGPVMWWQGTGNTWAGNTWADGSARGRLVSP